MFDILRPNWQVLPCIKTKIAFRELRMIHSLHGLCTFVFEAVLKARLLYTILAFCSSHTVGAILAGSPR